MALFVTHMHDAIKVQIFTSGSIVIQSKGRQQVKTATFQTEDKREPIRNDSFSAVSESDKSENLLWKNLKNLTALSHKMRILWKKVALSISFTSCTGRAMS